MKNEERQFEVMLLGGEYEGKMYDPAFEFERYYHNFRDENNRFSSEKLKNYLVHLIELENNNGLYLAIPEKKLNELTNKIINFMERISNDEKGKSLLDMRRRILPLEIASCGCCYSLHSELRGILIYE